MWEKLPLKKLLIFGGLLILVGGAYFFGVFLSWRRNSIGNNFARFEDGRRFHLEESAGMGYGGSARKDQRANLTGKIKSIQEGRIVIDKYVMPGDRQDEQSQSQTDNGTDGREHRWSGQNSDGAQSRPLPTISGEAIIVINESTVFVKNSQRGMRRPDQNNQPEAITMSDLKEGNIISVWSTTDPSSGNELATKIMLRAN